MYAKSPSVNSIYGEISMAGINKVIIVGFLGGQDRYTTEIQGDVLQMLDSRSDRQSDGYMPTAQPNYPGQSQSTPHATPTGKPTAEASRDNFDDDIPF